METLTESSQDRSGFASPARWSSGVSPDPKRPRRRSAAAGIACALFALACRAPITAPPPPRSGGPCADLAFAFFLVAEKRDRGSTREEQIEALQAGVASPFAQRPEQTLEELLRVSTSSTAAPMRRRASSRRSCASTASSTRAARRC
jgi:hypothetical protein